jgi:hypothetical protein
MIHSRAVKFLELPEKLFGDRPALIEMKKSEQEYASKRSAS